MSIMIFMCESCIKKTLNPPPPKNKKQTKKTHPLKCYISTGVSTFRCFSDGEYSTDTNVGCQIDFFF